MLLEEKEMAERKVKEVSELVESQAADFDRTRQGTLQSNALEFIYSYISVYHTFTYLQLLCLCSNERSLERARRGHEHQARSHKQIDEGTGEGWGSR